MSVSPIGSKLREHREAVVTELLAALNRQDVEASLACFTHPRYELVGNQRVFEGADQVRQYHETTFATFPDLSFEMIEVHHSERSMVVELWMSGSHLGSRTDFPATGRRFRCRVGAVFQFQEAALMGARYYYDTGTIARQLA